MKRISKFIFSISLLLTLEATFAQEATVDSLPVKTQRHGVRVGADIYKLARSVYDSDYRGFEVVGDYRLTKNHFVAGEIGNEKIIVDDARLNFTTSGTYFKVGFDYNAYENWLDMENVISVGLRYGVSSFNQTLNSYRIYNPYPYFGQSETIISGENFDGLSASWIEVVAGMKAELFNNVFAGFSFRINYLVTNKQPDSFENLYIPGFNRTYAGKFGVGFNYTISYFIPLYKKEITPEPKL